MVTLALFGLLAVLVAGVLFLAAAYLLPAGEQIAPPIRDEPLWELPSERALHSDDVAGVRLPVALRGYRFAETDLLLDRLGDELRVRDEEIARLKGVDDHDDHIAVPADVSAEGEHLWGRGSADGLGMDESTGSTESTEPPVSAAPELAFGAEPTMEPEHATTEPEPTTALETDETAQEPASAPRHATELETTHPSLIKRDPDDDSG